MDRRGQLRRRWRRDKQLQRLQGHQVWMIWVVRPRGHVVIEAERERRKIERRRRRRLSEPDASRIGIRGSGRRRARRYVCEIARILGRILHEDQFTAERPIAGEHSGGISRRAVHADARSEERRVGKECRAVWEEGG